MNYDSPSAHLERSLKINDLIAVAFKKKEVITYSPYYDVFGKYGERNDDMLKIDMVINRLNTWFLQAVQKARESRIY